MRNSARAAAVEAFFDDRSPSSGEVGGDRAIREFTAYTAMVSSKFGVKVVFDGTRAETDGRTIYLPNVKSLTERELKYLYGVLLHEIGHVEFSDFSESNFAMLSSRAEFIVANFIEDARVENLLMKKFGGARDIFTNMYCRDILDADLCSKVFGANPADCKDPFFIAGVMIHSELLDVRGLPAINVMFSDKRAVAKATKFYNEKVKPLLHPAPETWEGIVKVAKEVVSLYFADGDKSDQNSITDMRAVVDMVAKQIENSAKKAERISDIESQIKDLTAERALTEARVDAEVRAIRGEQASVRADVRKTNDLIRDINREVAKAKKIAIREKRIVNAEKELDKIWRRLEADNGLPQKKLTQSVENRLKAREDRKQKEIGKYRNEIDRIGEVNEDLVDLKPAAESKLKDLYKKLSDLESKIIDVRKPINKIDRQIFDKQVKKSSIEGEISADLDNMDDALMDAGLPPISGGVSSEMFEDTPGWEEIDDLQKAFDKEARNSVGGRVVNGRSVPGVAPGSRNVLIQLDKSASALKTIDLAEVFKEINRVSKLHDVGSPSEIRNTVEGKPFEVSDFSGVRNHVASTTEHDRVVIERDGDPEDRAKNAAAELAREISAARSVFARKFKNTKRVWRGNREEGDIDARDLWKLPAGSGDDFFEVSRKKPNNDVAVVIALDISGSMDKDYTDSGEKVMKLAVLLSDSLTAVGVDHEVVGCHAPVCDAMVKDAVDQSINRKANLLETVVYKQFSDRSRGSIGSVRLKCSDNSDGESLRAVNDQFKKCRKRRRIIITVTDGKPYLSKSDVTVMDADLVRAVAEVRKSGTEVLALGFNDGPEAFYGDSYRKLSSWWDVAEFFDGAL